MKKLLFATLIIALVVIQFFPAEKNLTAQPTGHEIETIYHLTNEIRSMIRTSCYDCHSNNTRYPWYSQIQPVGLWMGNHIKHAKEKLNFDTFSAYSPAEQYHLLEEIEETVAGKEMPLSSYTLMHRDADLNDDQRGALVNWIKEARRLMESKYEAESLIRKAEGDSH